MTLMTVPAWEAISSTVYLKTSKVFYGRVQKLASIITMQKTKNLSSCHPAITCLSGLFNQIIQEISGL